MMMSPDFSSALQCYVCNGCNDPFDPSQAREITCFGSCGKTKRGDCMYKTFN